MFVRVCARMFEPIQNQREYLIREKRKKERKKAENSNYLNVRVNDKKQRTKEKRNKTEARVLHIFLFPFPTFKCRKHF